MQELVYYPGFEVQSLDWLKFALLYIDRLNPIIPTSGRPFLSDLYRFLTNETDLLQIHQPDAQEGAAATLDALDCVEQILRSPERYFQFLGRDIVPRWTNEDSHTFIIFREKYTDPWERFCRDNQLGTQCAQGVSVHRQLALVYMALLAQVIADSRGISPITDYLGLNRLHLALRQTQGNIQRKVTLAQATLNLALPANLSEIDINDVIRLRNRQQYKSNLAAFHHELDSFLNNFEKGASPDAFIASLGSTWRELSEQMGILAADTIPLALGLWLVVPSPNIDVGQISISVTAGLSLVVRSTISISRTWRHTAIKRQARKYLANIRRIKRSPRHQQYRHQ